MTPKYRQYINEHCDDIFDEVQNFVTALGFIEPQIFDHDASPEEREQIFEENLQSGNGFRFMFGTVRDFATDAEANEGACELFGGRSMGL